MIRIILTVLGLVLVGKMMYAITYVVSVPDVYISYTTRECVKVVSYTDEIFNCENYPTKYNHIWVQ